MSTVKQASSRYVWYVVGVLTLCNAFSYMDRMALAVLAPGVKADLGLSDSQLGLLTGFAFSVFYAICGMPIARWADLTVRKNIIAGALAVWSIMTALSGAALNFWHLFAARVGIGVGEAGCSPAGVSLLCDYVPLKRRPGIFAIFNLGNYAGMMLGLVFAGWLGQTIGWRWTFVALGLPGIGLALVVLFTIREPVRGQLDAGHDSQVRLSFVKSLGVLSRCKTYRTLLALYAMNGFAQYGLIQWWPSFYTRTFELSMASIGLTMGLAIGIGSAVGSLTGGLLANKAARRDIRLPLVIGAAATLCALPTALATLFAPSANVSMACVMLTALFWSVSNGPIIAIASGVVPSTMRATASSVCTFFASVLGFGLGPFCVGVLSDYLMPSFGAQSLRYAMLVPACLFPLMALVVYLASRSLPEDLKAIEAAV